MRERMIVYTIEYEAWRNFVIRVFAEPRVGKRVARAGSCGKISRISGDMTFEAQLASCAVRRYVSEAGNMRP